MARCPFAIELRGPAHKTSGTSNKGGAVVHSAEYDLPEDEKVLYNALFSGREASWQFTITKWPFFVFQHYEVEAVCWHAGATANRWAVGIEIEMIAPGKIEPEQLMLLVKLLLWIKEQLLWDDFHSVGYDGRISEHARWMATNCAVFGNNQIDKQLLLANLERKGRPMPIEKEEAIGLLDAAIFSMNTGIQHTVRAKNLMLEHWSVSPLPSNKTIHLVLITYRNDSAWEDYYQALQKVPKWINDWLKPQGLVGNNWTTDIVRLPGAPGDYSLLKVVKAVNEGTAQDLPSKDHALYIFSQDPEMELTLYGTLGGDWFNGPQFPGVSYFMVQGLHALAYDVAHPTAAAKGETWTRNKALGAIAHELGHNLCGLPCVQALHGYDCVMKYWAGGMTKVYETRGYIYTESPPPFKAGDERKALADSGFMRKV